MAEILNLMIQKGGTGKTTTTGALAYILSEFHNKRTLVIDFDPQGNQTELLTGSDTEEYENQTILEALNDLDARPYVLQISDKLHLIPADDNLGIFPRWSTSRYYQRDKNGNVVFDDDGDIVISPEAGTVLKRTIQTVEDHFDIILIDTPPMISEFTANALIASTGCVVIYQTHPFCFTAVRRFLESVKQCQDETNPHLKFYGILPTMIDKRRIDANAYLEMIYEKYGEAVFKTIIKSQAVIGRLPIYGIDPEENKELDIALELFKSFTTELLGRMKKNQHFVITEEMIERDQ